MEAKIVHSDCVEFMRTLEDASVDSVVTDPPYELGFMGKSWDASGVAYRVDVWREALRVLKPGGHLLAFGGTRTMHRITCAIEDAGFEIRDSIVWLYGQGFPKSLDFATETVKDESGRKYSRPKAEFIGTPYESGGWGTALKPAHEPIAVARKPLVGTVASNVREHGTGAINIDGCRVSTDWSERSEAWKRSGHSARPDADKIAAPPGNGIECHPAGRWPPNVALSHLDECREVGARDVVRRMIDARARETPSMFGAMGGSVSIGTTIETVPAYDCAPGCPVAALDEQGGTLRTHGGSVTVGMAALGYGGRATGSARTVAPDSGGASRFFYTAKSSRSEREAGLPPPAEGRANTHPTVKPLALMRWLVRLVTPPGGLVLDPFTGSGTTGCAAVLEGFRFVGCDMTAEYVEIARARIAHWAGTRGPEQLKLTA